MNFLSKIFGKSGFQGAFNLIRPKNIKLNQFMTFLVTIVLVSLMLTTVAWAYKDGEFPGVGSYAKWQEANVYYNKAAAINNLPEEEALNKKAIEIYPYDAGFWINYAYSTNNKQEKIKRYLEAARLNPDDCRGYQGAGYEYQLLGDYNKAIELDKKGLSIDPSCSKIYVNLSDCLAKFKKYEEAINWLKKGYTITNNPDLLYDIGATYMDAGNYKSAKVYLDKCYIYKPNEKFLTDALKEVNKKLGLK